MRKIFNQLGLCLSSWFLLSPVFAQEKIVMTYWPAFTSAAMNESMQAKLEQVDIITYAFLGVAKDGTIRPPAQPDKLLAFTQLHNKTALKKTVSIGGAGSQVAFNNALNHLSNFIQSAAMIIQDNHLDGIDLDFEPRKFTSAQSDNYTKLVEALRKKLGNNTLITMAIAPDQNITPPFWKRLAENATYIADMCYEFHSPQYVPHYTGLASNLYSDPHEPAIKGFYSISCEESIKQLMAAGVPAQKLLLGFPLYGVAYGGVAAKNNGLFQAFDPHKTPYLDPKKQKGVVAYRTILTLLTQGFQEYAVSQQGKLSAVWAYNPQTQQFISYDNIALVKEKSSYVTKNKLAGLMAWEINDDVAGDQSLLKAAKRG